MGPFRITGTLVDLLHAAGTAVATFEPIDRTETATEEQAYAVAKLLLAAAAGAVDTANQLGRRYHFQMVAGVLTAEGAPSGPG